MDFFGDAGQLEQVYRDLPFECKMHSADCYLSPVEAVIEGRNAGTPFAFEPRLRFRAGEVTLWGGISGHGKSLLTGQVAMQLARQGCKSAIFSLEMAPERTLARMMRQFLDHRPMRKDAKPFLDKLGPFVTILNVRGNVTPEVVLGATIVAARDHRCGHIFIDNLMKCVSAEDDYNAQKMFVQSLCGLAQYLRVHIHLIHHVRKGQTEDDEVGKFSFRGSSSIVDQVDNAVLIQRNRSKERKRDVKTLSALEDADVGDSLLRIVKQRNGDYEGTVPLWFNPYRTAYCLDPGRKPLFEIKRDPEEVL